MGGRGNCRRAPRRRPQCVPIQWAGRTNSGRHEFKFGGQIICSLTLHLSDQSQCKRAARLKPISSEQSRRLGAPLGAKLIGPQGRSRPELWRRPRETSWRLARDCLWRAGGPSEWPPRWNGISEKILTFRVELELPASSRELPLRRARKAGKKEEKKRQKKATGEHNWRRRSMSARDKRRRQIEAERKWRSCKAAGQAEGGRASCWRQRSGGNDLSGPHYGIMFGELQIETREQVRLASGRDKERENGAALRPKLGNLHKVARRRTLFGPCRAMQSKTATHNWTQ